MSRNIYVPFNLSRTLRVVALLTAASLLPSPSPAAAEPPTSAPSDSMLRALTIENEKSLAKLDSADYVYHISTDEIAPDGNPAHYEGDISVRGRVPYQLSQEDATLLVPKAGIKQRQTKRTVLTPRYFAVLPDATGRYIYRFDYSTLTKAPPEIRSKIDYFQPQSLFAYGFGQGHLTLREVEARHADVNHWDVDQVAGENKSAQFVLKQYTPINPAHGPTFIYTIDPEKGFLITNFVAFDHIGRRISVASVKAGQDAKTGAWYPATTEERRYAPTIGADGTGLTGDAPLSQTTITVKSITVAEKIPDSVFDLDSLAAPKKSVLVETDEKGEEHLLRRIGQNFVPEPK